MPTGGVYSAGVGLQLQSATPGRTDSGNIHISGVALAGQFGCNDSHFNVFFGDGTTITTISQSTLVGYGANARSIGFGANGATCVGYGTICGSGAGWGNASTAIGWNAKVNNGSGTTGGNINIGGSSSVTDDGTGSVINIGYNVATQGCSNTVHINPSSDGSSVNGRTNVVAIGYAVVPRVTGSNQVVIGNGSITKVLIGPYAIGQSLGQTVTVNDANYAIASTDGIVAYLTLTAARTATLPTAASVPRGYIIKVADMSGAASGVNIITTAPNGTDTIVGPGAPTITGAYGADRFMSDGVSKWICNNNF